VWHSGDVQRHLALLRDVSHAVTGTFDVDALIAGALRALTGVTRHEYSSIHLLAPDGRAVELAVAEQAEVARHTAALRDDLEARIARDLPDIVVNGAAGPRAPHISNISIPGTDSEAMLMHLDLAGIACSSGSACSTGAVEPSHVLTAMGVSRELAIAALRFSFARTSAAADVDRVIEELPRITAKVRKLAGVLGR